MTHRGPFQPLPFRDSVILWFCDSLYITAAYHVDNYNSKEALNKQCSETNFCRNIVFILPCGLNLFFLFFPLEISKQYKHSWNVFIFFFYALPLFKCFTLDLDGVSRGWRASLHPAPAVLLTQTQSNHISVTASAFLLQLRNAEACSHMTKA